MTQQRKTLPFMTKYELVAILAERAQEISEANTPITIQHVNGLTPIQIAKLELKNGTLPKKVIRRLTDGTEEIWNINELQVLEEY